ESRLLTIREAARIQTFSDDFRFMGTYVEKASQIGNAVPPVLMFTFSQKIRECLLQSESPSLSLQATVSAQP
ncbi:MAG: DNA (cytosine-5-)-methyltransferase, partial [Anaerolineae bacterium CG17_big_fil_post_rev_8_21_14_2_50_57_27]